MTRLFLAALFLGAMVAGAVAEAWPGHNSKSWIVGGELQQHHVKGGTFWVNGLRFSFEDRPDATAWAEQQVGKRVVVTVRVE